MKALVLGCCLPFLLVSCGGGGGGASDGAGNLSVASNWRVLASLGSPRQEAGSALLNNEIYFIGGFNSRSEVVADVDVYNPASNTWRSVAPLPQALHHPNVAAAHGKVYVLGALLDANFSATGVTFEYDPASNTWASRSAMPPGTERGAAAAATIDNKIYVAGGLRNGVAITNFSVYDPATHTWAALPAMQVSRDHLVGAAVGGKFYAVGGRSGTSLRAQVEIFDPSTGSWSAGAPMPTPRGGCMGAAVNGRIVVVGGEGNRSAANGLFDTSELYDPTSNTWTVLERMRTPRHGAGAAAVGSELFVPGGAIVEGYGASAANEALRVP